MVIARHKYKTMHINYITIGKYKLKEADKKHYKKAFTLFHQIVKNKFRWFVDVFYEYKNRSWIFFSYSIQQETL